MGLAHIEFANAKPPLAIAWSAEASTRYVSFAGRSNVMTVAARFHGSSAALGLWLTVDAAYPASIAARDVKTLSWLVRLTDVVVASADGHAREHAEILRALLTDDLVDFSNSVATLTSAYNRPAPPEMIEVRWSDDGASVSSFDGVTWSLASSGSHEHVTFREFR